jgi:hypothetical protein
MRGERVAEQNSAIDSAYGDVGMVTGAVVVFIFASIDLIALAERKVTCPSPNRTLLPDPP